MSLTLCIISVVITHRMALLQLATAQHIYLLDMLTLTTVLTDEEWNAFAVQFFASDHVLKIGEW